MQIAGGRFLVTGGASLIGSHLTQQLLEAGAAAVILFDNYALGSPEVAASLAQDRRVTAVRGDITRLPELLEALDQVDGVFALAGFLTLPLGQHTEEVLLEHGFTLEDIAELRTQGAF